MKRPPKKPKDKQARSSITGRFVTWWYALLHPRTTIIERRKGANSGSN